MTRDVDVVLEDVLDSIQRIQGYTDGLDHDAFRDEPVVHDAVIWRLAVIGEAVKNLPDDLRDDHPDIRWSDIAGMRDVLIHGYFGVNLDRVWRVVQDDLPELERKASEILETQE